MNSVLFEDKFWFESIWETSLYLNVLIGDEDLGGRSSHHMFPIPVISLWSSLDTFRVWVGKASHCTERIDAVDLDPSGTDGFSQLKAKYRFESVDDWPAVADYTSGPILYSDDDEDVDEDLLRD